MDAFAAEVTGQVARRIRRRRRHPDVTREEPDLRAAFHRTRIRLIERGVRIPSPDTLIRLAGGLDLSLCRLLEGSGRGPAGPAPADPTGADDG